jgi:hypothetical protein
VKCSICHEELPSPDAICPGRLPGPCGLVQFSPGKCKSTPEQRAEVDANRQRAAKREVDRAHDKKEYVEER